MIRTSEISRPLVLITVLLVGTLMSTAAFAAGLWGGQARGSGGGGQVGGGRAGGPGFSGGGHVGGGRVGGPGFSGSRPVGGSWRGGNWNRGRNVGIYLGAPIGFRYGSYPYPYYGTSYYGTSYYGAPYYYPPAPVYYPVAQPETVTYIERSDEPQIDTQEASNDSPQNAQASWWYYCVDAKAYYPYVNQCPGGWLRVAPQPASDSDDQPSPDNSPAS
ncbi:MAG: hypothetical protein WAQ56_09400 [Candidatus Nitrotoga sp.]|jgi:hypothetical protein